MQSLQLLFLSVVLKLIQQTAQNQLHAQPLLNLNKKIITVITAALAPVIKIIALINNVAVVILKIAVANLQLLKSLKHLNHSNCSFYSSFEYLFKAAYNL